MKKSIKVLLLLAAIFSVKTVFAQLPVSSNGKFVTVNGAQIYYEEFGQGEPLLLLHGFNRSIEDWNLLIPEYAKNFRVIAWDMRGNARSTNPDTSIAFPHSRVGKDLLAFMDAINLPKVKVVGHSSGAMAILYAASIAPERFDAIIPVAGQMYYSNQVREFIEKFAKPIVPNPQSYRLHGKEKADHLNQQFYNFRKLYGDPSLTPDQLSKITARTLVIHGDNDFVPVSQSWEIYRSIPKAHIWISPNTGHEPQGHGNEQDFLKKTIGFLKGEWDKKN